MVGLTGGIACGKSAVSSELQRDNWTVIDADKIAREIMDSDEELKLLVVQTFGDDVIENPDTYRKKGLRINRTKLAQIVFGNPLKRKQLNSLTHTRIFKAIFKEMFVVCILRCRTKVVLDAPLLFETKIFEWFCFPIITVFIKDESVQLQRLMDRNGLTIEEAKAKIDAQMPITLKM
jgi:dephospho-CoA kinase